MKHILITFLVLTAGLGILYASIAFYWLTLNPVGWSESARSVFSVFGFMITMIIIGSSVGIYFETKKEKRV
ncbi:hypothetical protein [Chryseobacterium indologenes]|uniref:hypothetical protein n=1 Tax=Chryseobacterium indologenes TaxID=253 RepID=UPI00162874D7|nr:hypothetical protein [Chryseobacterium indologenes]